jgi:hypothetical protein
MFYLPDSGWVMAAVLALSGSATGLPQTSNGANRKESGAAEQTRMRSLKVRVTGTFTDVRLGDILKEFGAQVEMKTEQPLMWNYGKAFPFATRVNLTVKDEPLDAALDKLLTHVGEGLGYVIVSSEGDRYDGWIRLTTTGERGGEPLPASREDEEAATERLTLAKKLIDAGKPASAKPLLEILVRKYPTTKAGVEARGLLRKIEQ